MKNQSGAAIPFDVATKLCSDYRTEKGVKMFSQCWGCVRFSKGDPTKMCFYNNADNRGCGKVNEKYDKLHPA